MFTIKSSEIKSETIPDAITEICHNPNFDSAIRQIANMWGKAEGNVVEAIAQHIIMTDTDFVYPFEE